jgi:hypothetical protein
MGSTRVKFFDHDLLPHFQRFLWKPFLRGVVELMSTRKPSIMDSFLVFNGPVRTSQNILASKDRRPFEFVAKHLFVVTSRGAIATGFL